MKTQKNQAIETGTVFAESMLNRISTYNEYNAYIGGFAGRMNNANSSISACYATGTVSVVQNGDSSGLVGLPPMTGTLTSWESTGFQGWGGSKEQ